MESITNTPPGPLTAVSDYAAAVTFASLTVVVTIALIALSALVSRLQQPGLARPYRLPLWPLPPAVALTGVAAKPEDLGTSP